MCTQRNNNIKKETKEEEEDKVTTVSVWICTLNAKSEMSLKRNKKEEKAFKEKKKSHHLNMMIKQELFVI